MFIVVPLGARERREREHRERERERERQRERERERQTEKMHDCGARKIDDLNNILGR